MTKAPSLQDILYAHEKFDLANAEAIAQRIIGEAKSRPHVPEYDPVLPAQFLDFFKSHFDYDDRKLFFDQWFHASVMHPAVFLQYSTLLLGIAICTIRGTKTGEDVRDIFKLNPIEAVMENYDLFMIAHGHFKPDKDYWDHVEHEEMLFNQMTLDRKTKRIVTRRGQDNEEDFKRMMPFRVGTPKYFGARLPSVIVKKAVIAGNSYREAGQFYDRLDEVKTNKDLSLRLNILYDDIATINPILFSHVTLLKPQVAAQIYQAEIEARIRP